MGTTVRTIICNFSSAENKLAELDLQIGNASFKFFKDAVIFHISLRYGTWIAGIKYKQITWQRLPRYWSVNLLNR